MAISITSNIDTINVMDIQSNKIDIKDEKVNIKKVIFNPPATIVLWEDGKKTVVKCNPEDKYDKLVGLLLCIAKYAFGNTGKYNRELDKWCPEEPVEAECNNKSDENYTIFHDDEIMKNLKSVIYRLTDEYLIKAYVELNAWKLPEYFTGIISLPTYVYDNFKSLPIKIRNKSITPIIQMVKDEIVQRNYERYLEQLPPFEYDNMKSIYTWERYQEDEH